LRRDIGLRRRAGGLAGIEGAAQVEHFEDILPEDG
jgi:hypothetical protein